MSTQNPATPSNEATPGNGEQGTSVPPVSTPPASTTPGTEGQTEGKVTISTKEYAELQRAKARAASLDRRNALNQRRQPPINSNNTDPDDQTAQELARLQQDIAEKDRLLMRERLTNRVRGILEKEEFKSLPKSTRDLILKNPSVLSNADNEEEALLDIEDYVREQVADMSVPMTPSQTNTPPAPSQNPPGHETPPKVGGGSPAHSSGDLEDTSRLRGDARAMATLRNVLRKSNK